MRKILAFCLTYGSICVVLLEISQITRAQEPGKSVETAGPLSIATTSSPTANSALQDSPQLRAAEQPVQAAPITLAEAELVIPTTLQMTESIDDQASSDFSEIVIDDALIEVWNSDGSQVELIPSTVSDETTEELASDIDTIWFGDWVGYNATESDMTWLPGSKDDFGMFSMESFPTLPLSNLTDISTGIGFHFLNGPASTDMPPRLFDFQIAYQSRARRTDNFVLDYRIGVGAFSDFEGSARKGIRFPGHAVGYYQWHPWLLSVLGIEFLDRDDVSVLPVVGVVYRPRHDVVVQAIFPRPQIQVKLKEDNFLYLGAELGGGTWAVERTTDEDDVVTYSDYRILFGLASLEEDSASSVELGWALSRSLEYRSGLGNYRPDDAFLIRFRQLY